MSEFDDIRHRLADLAGAHAGFRDQNGSWVETSLEARLRVLDGFGLKSQTEAEARESLIGLEKLRNGLIPALIVSVPGQSPRIAIKTSAGEAGFRLTDESGAVRDGRVPVSDGLVLLPPLNMGYFALELSAGDDTGSATIISAPPRCYLPDVLSRGARLWGTVAQVYGLTSARSMGIGEYTDVAEAATGTGTLGGDFLGLSPLHALFAADRSKYSPYSPSSRLFLETLHLDITAISGFSGSKAAELMDSAEYRAKLAVLRSAPLVDHEGVWALKRPLLDALFADFLMDGTDADFEAFRKEGGEPLKLHAAFEALSEHFRGENRNWTGEWPDAFRSPKSEVVSWFCDEKADLVTFHAWLQYLADKQLNEAANAARESGMAIGLYRDLAVGGDRSGSEVWAAPELFSPTLSVGAPPDPLGPQGQNWGLPPMDPFALERHGLKAFRALVTANMRHAGAIRIDHAFQLRRLFLIPEGGHGPDGAYVDFPFEGLLAVLRLESHRSKCIVIAEDLGTAPEGFSDAIMHAGLLSYRVMYFERGEHGRFKKPAEYPRDAMSVFTTHDLPTLRGWWHGGDIDLRENLAVFDPERAGHERTARREDVRKFCQALNEEGLLDTAEPPPEPPLDAAIRFIARAPSALTAIQFEDAAGEIDQANLPGVETGHPNWRRRIFTNVQELTGHSSRLAGWAKLLSGEGRRRPGPA
ncbi:4-alpha-glucanotransferase [Terrihabitans soli]|uniref:4-alpha-glucanotransferase n=1 Tax=Terrihabitans soli TaxID=708113 RepID=A0A6S6QZH8_9HYPH|nr:4-alpha-glucanotransferase [Terrihabitans soli]BCJ92058.1 4-alpha-glucanotransferase [Terrihabitans soli]